VYGNDLTGGLMAQDMVALDYHGPDAAMLPEVNV
jgi:hypothetical protein